MVTREASDNSAQPPVLYAYLLGQVTVADALYLQRKLLYDCSGNRGTRAALLLCEHPTSLTIGRKGSRLHIVPDDDELRRREIPLVWVPRGGGCWLHLPGQLVTYAVFPIMHCGPSRYREGVRDAIKAVLTELGVGPFSIGPDGTVESTGRLLGAMGIAIHRSYATFGFWLNVSLQTHHFKMLQFDQGVPVRATTIEALRGKRTRMSLVRECVVRQYCRALGVSEYFVSAGEHQLRTWFSSDAKLTGRAS